MKMKFTMGDFNLHMHNEGDVAIKDLAVEFELQPNEIPEMLKEVKEIVKNVRVKNVRYTNNKKFRKF